MDPEPSLNFLETIDFNIILGFLVIFTLLICSALVSAAEVAFFSLTPTDLEEVSQDNPVKAKIIISLIEKPKKLLATLLVANNAVNMGIVIIFSFVAHPLFDSISSPVIKFITEVIIVTFLILLCGEVLPKIYANRNNIKFAKFFAYPLSLLDKLLTPISVPMRSMTLFLHEKLGKQKSNFSVDQLSQALELTSSEGSTIEEQKILEGIVSFGNTDTKQVMSPRIDIFALKMEESLNENMAKIT